MSLSGRRENIAVGKLQENTNKKMRIIFIWFLAL